MDEEDVSHDKFMESNELMLLRAAWHMKSARTQRKLIRRILCMVAVIDAKNRILYSQRNYTFVVN